PVAEARDVHTTSLVVSKAVSASTLHSSALNNSYARSLASAIPGAPLHQALAKGRFDPLLLLLVLLPDPWTLYDSSGSRRKSGQLPASTSSQDRSYWKAIRAAWRRSASPVIRHSSSNAYPIPDAPCDRPVRLYAPRLMSDRHEYPLQFLSADVNNSPAN